MGNVLTLGFSVAIDPFRPPAVDLWRAAQEVSVEGMRSAQRHDRGVVSTFL